MEKVNGQPALASIRFLTGSLAGSIYQITRPTTTLGREPANDIVLSDPSISRHHAQITWNNGVWTIIKLTPQNTVTVNQRDVQQSAINDSDTIGLGSTSFLFQSSANAHRGIPSLEVNSNTHPEKTPYSLTKQVINVGRHPSNDIVINETVVSTFHAQIVREGNQFIFIHPNPSSPGPPMVSCTRAA